MDTNGDHPNDEGDVLFGYEAGLRSASDVVSAAKEYRGGESHYLWDALLVPSSSPTSNHHEWRGGSRVRFLFHELSENQMHELVRAFVEDDPAFPYKRHPVYGCFLHAAIFSAPIRPAVRDPPPRAAAGGDPPRASHVSSRVIFLLAVSGTTRTWGRSCRESSRRFLPLYACLDQDVGLDVIDRLIELDPHVIDLPGNQTTWNPLHHIIMMHNPVNVPILSRMAEANPDALFSRDVSGRTPVHMALEEARQPATPQLASLLEALVRRFPGTFPQATRNGLRTALFGACRNFHTYSGLLRAVIADYPMALCIDCAAGSGGGGLPCDAAAERQSPNMALLEEHTLHMALAVVELALGGAFSPSSASSWSSVSSSSSLGWSTRSSSYFARGEGPETFQAHVRDTVRTFLAASPSAAEDRPYAVAESIRNLENRVDCCRALFRTRTARAVMLLVSQPGNDLGKTVVDMYRMNCRGRANPSAAHQVRLLASVQDNLDCVYLQFREFWVHVLPQNEASSRNRKRRYGA
jgi:hypothetical protein